MLFDNDDNLCAALMKRQPHTNLDNDTHENIPFLSTESPVAIHDEDGRSWINRMIIGHGSGDHNGRSHRLLVAKMECIIPRMERYIKTTQGIAKD